MADATQNWWDSYPTGQPAPAPPAAPVQPRAVVAIGRPPREASPQTPPQILHDEHTARTAGLPSGFEWDANGQGAHPIHGTPMDPTYGQNTVDPTSITDAEHRVAQAMITGRVAPPTGRNLATPQTMRLLAVASQLDPEFDLTTWQRRSAASRAYTSGVQGRNITSFNTAIHHIARYALGADALDNWGGENTPAALSHISNSLRNAMANGNLAGRLTTFNNNADAVASELTSAFRGTNGAEADVQAWRANLRPNMTPQEFHASVQSALDLLRGRIEAMNSSYRQAMGPNATVEDLIDPHSRDILHSLESGTLGTPAPPPAPPSAPSGPQGPGPPPPSAPPQQTGPIQFGARPQTPTGFEQFQIHAYDAFMQANPHATVEQLQAAFPNVSNARQIVAFRDQRGVVAPGSSWVMARPNAPAADITGSRGGSPEAMARQISENTISQGVPLIGGIVQADQALRGPEAGNALLHGGQDWALLGGRDELAAGMNALLGNGGYDRNIAQERGVDAYDSEHHFGDRLTGQIAAGLPEALLPGGLAAQVARSGAQGAAYGFGSGEDSFANRAGNALVGGGLGLAAPLAFNLAGGAVRPVANFLARPFRSAAVTPEAQAIAQAGADENVRLSRPIVDPSARNMAAMRESQPGTSGIVRDSMANTASDIEARAGSLGAGGTAEDTGTIGSRIQDAGRRFIATSRTMRDKLYDRAAQMAGNATVQPWRVVRALNDGIKELSGNAESNAGEIGFLQTTLRDLVDEHGNIIPKTVQEIRDLRTNLRGRINEAGLTYTQAEGRVMGALNQAKDDIARDLGRSNPGAVRAYARADQFNAQRADEIKQIVQPIIGPRNNPLSGERVWQNIRTMAGPRGNSAGMARLWSHLEPAEQLDAAATLAESAGRRAPDEPFSPALFVNFARSLSPAARQTAFGPEGARSIANLNALSQAFTAAQKGLNNSRSGVVRNYAAFFRDFLKGGLPGAAAEMLAGGSALGGGAAGIVAGSALSLAGLAARRMSARALMSPDMSRWLAVAPSQTTAAAIRTHVARLSAIASRDPAIAQEVLGLRNALMNAVNDNAPQMGAAAASPDGGPNEQQ